MTDPIRIAVEALQEKATELVEERVAIRRRMLEDAVRDQEIERDINGCFGGAKALGAEIEVFQFQPSVNQAVSFNNFISGRNAIAGTYKILKEPFGVEDDANVEDEGDENGSSPEMPRIADIVLERLRIAGTDGSKAAEIRRHILRTYKADIHEKTVGMTLYRLQKDGKVARDGHTWFLASSEAKNPGAATPGPNNSQT